MRPTREDITRAKIDLYRLILELNREETTDNDMDVCAVLTEDFYMQKLLQGNIKQ